MPNRRPRELQSQAELNLKHVKHLALTRLGLSVGNHCSGWTGKHQHHEAELGTAWSRNFVARITWMLLPNPPEVKVHIPACRMNSANNNSQHKLSQKLPDFPHDRPNLRVAFGVATPVVGPDGDEISS